MSLIVDCAEKHNFQYESGFIFPIKPGQITH